MKATKIVSTGALAAALTLGGLAVQARADSQTNVKEDAPKTVQGAEHKCGSGNCGASKPDDQKDKTTSHKQGDEKNASSKGASHSCGSAKCGS
jgi:uncharacterized low-complexity protein